MWLDGYGYALSCFFKKGMAVLCKSLGIWDGIVNPTYGYGAEINPYINPIYGGLGRSFTRDSKNLSFVDVGIV